jgi:Putative transposase
MLQSVPPRGEPPSSERVAQASGFSLHAGVAAAMDQRGTLERLCRYIARPAVAIERLSLTAQGLIRYALKTPYRDGTTHVIFEPLDFLARLAAPVPSPGVNLTRYRGVFAPNHRLRARIVPGKRGCGGSAVQGQGGAVPKHAAMTWAQHRPHPAASGAGGQQLTQQSPAPDTSNASPTSASTRQVNRRPQAPHPATAFFALPRDAPAILRVLQAESVLTGIHPCPPAGTARDRPRGRGRSLR